MEKHTPGPLSTCGCQGSVWSSNVIAFCPLHAAAPEMLEALERIAGVGQIGYPTLLAYYHDINTCEAPDNCEHCLAGGQARTAIRKATGG